MDAELIEKIIIMLESICSPKHQIIVGDIESEDNNYRRSGW